MDASMVGPEETFAIGNDPYAAAADEWAATQPEVLEADDDEAAARRLYDLALEYQERSQRSESRLLDQFEAASTNLSARLGDLIIVDDDDERLTLTANDGFKAEVVPEDAGGEWRTLETPEELVEFYDPTDVFGDLADALAEAWPSVVPEAELEEVRPADEADGADDEEEGTDGSKNGSGGLPRE
jgi:hypothetical protein